MSRDLCQDILPQGQSFLDEEQLSRTCLGGHEVRRADAAAVDGLRLVLQLGGQLDRHAETAELHRRRVLLAAMRRHASLAASPLDFMDADVN